jgi:hypothetical protein
MRRLDEKATLKQVAITVGHALRKRGLKAVLTGGACATIYSGGAYLSVDVDYVFDERVPERDVELALSEVGFRRRGDRFVHPKVVYYVEFPRGPVAIGSDDAIRPVRLRLGNAEALSLSATDSCRDRLAAFYYWDDRVSFDTALQIARRNRVDMRKIGAWSAAEGMSDRFDEFRRALRRQRPFRARQNRRNGRVWSADRQGAVRRRPEKQR